MVAHIGSANHAGCAVTLAPVSGSIGTSWSPADEPAPHDEMTSYRYSYLACRAWERDEATPVTTILLTNAFQVQESRLHSNPELQSKSALPCPPVVEHETCNPEIHTPSALRGSSPLALCRFQSVFPWALLTTL